jgi:NTE family protein
MSPAPGSPRRALVLSGGGARGAYEAGVLRWILRELPKRLGRRARFEVVCGTSVGAIHACFYAATTHLEPARAAELTTIWERMRFDEIFHLGATDVLRLPRKLLGLWRGQRPSEESPPQRIAGLLDTEPLELMVVRGVPWHRIRANLRAGHFDAICIAATEIATGRVIVFIESSEEEVPGWPEDASIVARGTRLRPEHALASASIPVLFPAVRVGETYFADGGLRLNTPLAPALRLGADRVLVLATGRGASAPSGAELERHRVESYGNPVFLFGKVLNALLLSHVDSDLARLAFTNEMLRAGERAFGPDFLARLNAGRGPAHPDPYRIVEELVIRPSEDLGLLAGSVLSGRRAGAGLTPFLDVVFRAARLAEEPFEADLLSYLFFDTEYCQHLLALGFDDAQAREEELVRFFSDEPLRARGADPAPR